MCKKYAVYPGFIHSKNDWDVHYIGAEQLMYLYGVNPRECVVIRSPEDEYGLRDADLLTLVPKWGGNYDLVRKIEEIRNGE